jgi:hypothetical protein
MRTFRSVLIVALACCVAHLSLAGDFAFSGVALVVPDQFAGPARAAPASNAESIAFAVSRGPGVPGTALQITRYDFGDPLPMDTEDDKFNAASQYLLEMLKGIERHRTSYTQTVPVKALLAGTVSARSSWKGNLHGIPVNGVMFCFVRGSTVLFFHAFGSGDNPDDDMILAVKAIEDLRIAG